MSQRDVITLADLIDLEMQIVEDADADQGALRRRDAEIGRKIGSDQLHPPQIYLAWIGEIRSGGGKADASSTGQRAERYLGTMGALLFVAGLVLGALAVGGSLAYGTQRPVNVILFWCAFAGLQILLLLLWCLSIVPQRWLARLPGAAAVQDVVRAVGRMPPAAMAWLSERLSSENRELVRRLRGTWRSWDRVYAGLRLWILVRLTQVFALAYNLAVVATFVVFSYISDPSFGWRSTMLDDEQLYTVTRVVSTPWSWQPEAMLSREEIAATRFSSLDETLDHESQVWAWWWPFLLASLLTYGLLPRVATLAISHFQVHRLISRAAFDRTPYRRLAERLRASEPSGDDRSEKALGDQRSPLLAGERASALLWQGIPLSEEECRRMIEQRLRTQVTFCGKVGAMDVNADARAIESATSESQDSVVLIVPAWAPPVAEHRDVLQNIRGRIGDGVPIFVVLCHQDIDGKIVEPRGQDSEIWNRIELDGDPWLRVEPLVEGAPA